LRLVPGALLAGLILVAASGCGTGGAAEGGNASQGKTLFRTECAECHTLKDAAAAGVIGPNLDSAFRRSKEEGFEESTIRNVVLDQIRFPTKGSVMPANLVRGQDAEDVAAYVAECAAATKEDKDACPGVVVGSGAMGLYASLGCQGCHSLDGSPSSGPTFKGLFGSDRKLADGTTVKADDQYLLDAILDPDRQIVDGFQPGVMSAVIGKGQVKEADAKLLVDFIKKEK
jgi:mono/diheme cytochrome c family protein